jgi:hypothetical protein
LANLSSLIAHIAQRTAALHRGTEGLAEPICMPEFTPAR